MKSITLDIDGINNFHNSPPITVRVTGEALSHYTEHDEETVYSISKGQAKRIQRHFCGITDCRCAAGGVVVQLNPEGTEFGLRVKELQ